jgi:hypothetical protein
VEVAHREHLILRLTVLADETTHVAQPLPASKLPARLLAEEDSDRSILGRRRSPRRKRRGLKTPIVCCVVRNVLRIAVMPARSLVATSLGLDQSSVDADTMTIGASRVVRCSASPTAWLVDAELRLVGRRPVVGTRESFDEPNGIAFFTMPCVSKLSLTANRAELCWKFKLHMSC